MTILNFQWNYFSKLFGKQTVYINAKYTMSPYVYKLEIKDGTLLYNTLSLELVFVSKDETDQLIDHHSVLRKTLTEKWFYFQEDFSPQSMLHLLKQKRLYDHDSTLNGKIVYATILTTTDCNARCKYCYESGCEKNTMSTDTCKQVVEYIRKNSDDITIRWFGGEPLVNAEAINYISSELKNSRIPYRSNMISNGYLLDKFDDNTLLNLWKLERIQLTIDGTEQEYLKIKNLPRDSYTKVINQAIRCAKIGIKVNIRIHVTLQNADDIKILIQELNKHFESIGDMRKNIYIYLHPLFIGLGDVDTHLTDEQDIMLANKFIELDRFLRTFQKRKRKISIPKSVHCMASSKNHIVITPTGKLTVCEHCSDREFVGDIHAGIENIPDKWYEPKKEQPECKTCFYAPLCNRLEMCESESYCTVGHRMILEYKIKATMQQYYLRWKADVEKRKTIPIPATLSKLYSIAIAEIGSKNWLKYSTDIFGKENKDPWCIIFLCWIFFVAFGKEKALKMLCLEDFTSDVIQLLDAFKNANMFTYRTVQPGYIVFLRMNRRWTCHAELVIDVTDSSIITIGGNCNGKVQKNEYSREDDRISGFGKIIYE